MEQETKKIPFPQADKFEKIIKIIELEDEDTLLDNTKMYNILDVTVDRQVIYYIAACRFLDIIDVGSRTFSNYGLLLRHMSKDMRNMSLCAKIVSKPVFGEVFFAKFIYGYEMDDEAIEELMLLRYGEEMKNLASRRSRTVLSWVDWVFEQSEMWNANIMV